MKCLFRPVHVSFCKLWGPFDETISRMFLSKVCLEQVVSLWHSLGVCRIFSQGSPQMTFSLITHKSKGYKVMHSETRLFFFRKVNSFLDKTHVNQVPEADLWVRSSTYWVPTTTKCTIHKALECSGQHDHCRLRPQESQTIIRRLNCKYESRLKKSTQVTALW